MHNGYNGLEGAPECVGHLKSLGKKLIILSNTSSPSQTALQKLPKLGFQKEDFLGAVTSGEEASRHIKETYGSKPTKVLWITWSSDTQPSPRNFLDLCGDSISLLNVDEATEADLIIAHGAGVIQGHSEETSIGDFMSKGDLSFLEPIFEKCVKQKIPMVCANPDFIVVKPDGSRGHMPGKIAQLYENFGGSCTYFGKPHVPHFEACLRELGLVKDKVAHVGDSLHHDVAGANGAGIDSIFVTGGVHRDELGADLGILPEVEDLARVFETEGHIPTHVVPMFRL